MSEIVRVLHLEDDPLDAELIQNTVKAAGVPWLIRRVDGQDGFETMLAMETFDLVLCDFNLPGYDGMVALRTACERQPKAPVIILSGALDEATAVACLHAGAIDYVPKQRLQRLVPAMTRALRETAEQRRRLHTEAALRESEARFRLFMDNSPVAAFIKDGNGRYVYGNPAWSQFLAKPPAQWLGKTDHRLFSAETAATFQRADAAVYAGDGAVEETVSISGSANAHYWWTLTKFPLQRPDGHRLIGGFAVDITARRRAEAEVRQRQLELTHAGRLTLMGEMATGIAHELNQPLTAIATYCDAAVNLASKHGVQPPDLLLALKGIQQQAQRAGDIVHRLRDFIRRRHGEIKPQDLNALIEETIAFVKLEAHLNSITIRLDLAATLPHLNLDKVLIEQVLVNLLHNSIEAMAHTPRQPRQLTISTYPPMAGTILVTVHDTGPGLDSERIQHLFERFQSSKPQGIGLGLAISRSIIEAHAGKLWAESTADGASFHFTLPVVEQQTQATSP